jgi:hypothetical protein
MSMPRFEYRVCQVQESRVTYVNGNWQGRVAPAQGNVRDALSSCLFEWEFLSTAGEDGWQLVAASSCVGGDASARVLYLRRGRE